MKEKNLLIFFVYLGIALRLLWPNDIEWKADESYAFEYGLAWARGEKPWPWLGVTSGAGLANPPFGFWILMLFSAWTKDPVHATQLVSILNALSLWVALLWAQKDSQKLWTLALFSVSFFPVLFAKKLWIQCLLPPFLLILEWSSEKRKSLTQFVSGFVLCLLGQVHMSGFLFAPLWLFVRADRRKSFSKSFWMGVLLAIPLMIPWMIEILTHLSKGSSSGGHLFREILNPAPLLKLFSFIFSLEDFYSLGAHAWDFVKLPPVFLSYSISIVFLLLHARLFFQRFQFSDGMEKAFVLGFVPLFMLIGVSFPMHYLIVWFLWPFMWLVRRTTKYFENSKIWLWSFLVAQLIHTASFWYWVRQQPQEYMETTPMGILYKNQPVPK